MRDNLFSVVKVYFETQPHILLEKNLSSVPAIIPQIEQWTLFPIWQWKPLLFTLVFAEIAEIVRATWTEILQALPSMPISAQILSAGVPRVVPGVDGFGLSLVQSHLRICSKDTFRKCRSKFLKEGHPKETLKINI